MSAETERSIVPDQEMFLSKPAPETGGGDSPTIEPLRIFRGQSPTSNGPKYPAPPSSTSPAARKSSFPLPPGASSSAAPLPFPEDDDVDERKPTPPEPYGSAYNDTSPRLDGSPLGKRPGLAERRGTVPRPISSPSSPEADQGLFARPLQDRTRRQTSSSQNRIYYPPPGTTSSSSAHPASQSSHRNEHAVSRFPSTASTSTTKANRGSPPPPETPIAEPGHLPSGGIEARYAASGISGTATLNGLQPHPVQSAAATQRLAQYGNQSSLPQRPWTPTESPGRAPSGPPQVYLGTNPVSNTQPQSSFNLPEQHPSLPQGQPALQVSVLEQDLQRMETNSPPPAYSSVNNRATSSSIEKQRQQQQRTDSSPAQPTAAQSSSPAKNAGALPRPAPSVASAALQHPGHPAFANEPRPEVNGEGSQAPQNATLQTAPTSPPPLPEGWIAHMDQNSGQYYYIHLATQATQWEFPKGPNPIPHETPLSPTASTYGNPLSSPAMYGNPLSSPAMYGNPLSSPAMYGNPSLNSPMFSPQTPGYAESIMSVAMSQTPTAVGFSGPPPSAGVDMYRVQPTNGVYFGPYLRYVNMDLEKGVWYGSILIVSDAPQPPTIHIHLSIDLSPNPRQLQPHSISTHQRWTFYKYDIELQMGENGTERWTYAVTSHLGCTRYEFVVAGQSELSWRFIAHSGNDFAVSTNQNERARLGGVGFMWKDVLQKNVECGGFHVQLGLGDQIYGDRLWKEVPLLKQWLAMSGREHKKNVQWTARHEEDVSHAYFHYYTSHFDQPYLREAFAQIPHVLQIDDHDIFDGYGSYPNYMQASAIFQNIGRVARDMYLLFQHHTTLEMLRNVSTDHDLFTITGSGWQFIKFLGPAVALLGLDCRSERTQARVVAGQTYQGLFPKLVRLPPSVQHLVCMISVPLVYPRLETVETLANTMAAGKKAVNTTYNILGKVTSSVAGVVGGKEVVSQGFSQVKKAVGKSGLMGNVLNQFGELDIQEVLKDMWTHDSKDLERTYLIRTLQGISKQKGIRMTFLSGDVNASGAGLVHDPTHPGDHKTMYQIISSPIVSAPQSNYVLKLLHNQKSLYVPQNGHKSNHEVSDTKEDMMEIFHTDASGVSRELKKLMGRRTFVAFMAYDHDAVAQNHVPFSPNPSISSHQPQGCKLSLAVDFIVQGDGAYNATTKYGPVIVPHLEFGR